jgi:hypothetical protein
MWLLTYNDFFPTSPTSQSATGYQNSTQKKYKVLTASDDMSMRGPMCLNLVIGVALIVIAFLFPEGPYRTSTWVGIASVYLFTVGLLEIPRLIGVQNQISFRYAVSTAIAVLIVPVVLRLWTVRTARSSLALSEVTFIFAGFQLLVPFVAAFMIPLGRASTRMHKRSLLILIMALHVFALADSLSDGAGFGPTFAVGYQLAVLVSGIVAGLPLYYYGRNLPK